MTMRRMSGESGAMVRSSLALEEFEGKGQGLVPSVSIWMTRKRNSLVWRPMNKVLGVPAMKKIGGELTRSGSIKFELRVVGQRTLQTTIIR